LFLGINYDGARMGKRNVAGGSASFDEIDADLDCGKFDDRIRGDVVARPAGPRRMISRRE
jgi:hypothetical protein